MWLRRSAVRLRPQGPIQSPQGSSRATRCGEIMKRRRGLLFATGAAALALFSIVGQHAWSQARTIKVVVPFAPGGGADTLARLLTDQIGAAQRVTTVVENRPGAGTAIGTEAVARAA